MKTYDALENVNKIYQYIFFVIKKYCKGGF